MVVKVTALAATARVQAAGGGAARKLQAWLPVTIPSKLMTILEMQTIMVQARARRHLSSVVDGSKGNVSVDKAAGGGGGVVAANQKCYHPCHHRGRAAASLG